VAAYFVAFKLTGVIGHIGTILNALCFFAVGLLLNIIIQRTRGADLRLRIAGANSFFTLWSELRATKTPPPADRALIQIGLLFLVLAGDAIPFIVNTGIKATTTGIVRHPTAPRRFSDFAMTSSTDPGHIIQSRLNSSYLLTELYMDVVERWTYSTYSGQISSALPFGHPTPGTVSLTRQLYTFSKNATPSCDQTSPNCELSSMRTTLAPWANPSYLFDTPWNVVYNDHEGNPITIANVSSAVGTGNALRDSYIAERPTTFIAGYTEANGISVMVALTTASFQTEFSTNYYGNSTFIWAAADTIRSLEPLYSSIYYALNASVSAQLQNGTTASNSVTLVYNTPSATSDNSTHIICVLYEANSQQPDQPNQIQYMVSCRELHISVMSNTGATRAEGDDNDYIPRQDYAMLLIFNATSPSQINLNNNEILYENVTEVAM
ncbi:hypothetical protein BGX26_005307, partial [Mortierella sp. AD094]